MKAKAFRLQFLLLPTILLAISGNAIASHAPSRSVLGNQYLAPQATDLRQPDRSGVPTRSDTTWFGGYTIVGGEYHALSGPNKQDVMWTFDRGIGPHGDPNRIEDGEGWRSIDETANDQTFFRRIDGTLDLGDGVAPPIITGQGSLWVGADAPQAAAFCWICGPGYGNDWCQRITTEPLAYDGSGAVTLSFKYFSDSEQCFDGTQVYLKRADNTELLLNPYPGDCPENVWHDGFTGTIGSASAPATYTRVVTAGEIGAAQSIRFVIEFTSDDGWSDEDGEFCETYGPFGADDVTIDGGGIHAIQDFETGITPWVASFCPGIGSFAGIAPLGCYGYIDPCQCRLSGNVLEMHEGDCPAGTHPQGQLESIESPICDIGSGEPHSILLDFDMFADMPFEDGVLFRVMWKYYPWTCPVTGATGWSPAMGNTFESTGSTPGCFSLRYSATGGPNGVPIPQTSQKVKAIIELVSDCSAFTIDPCSGETNASPLFDNIAVGATAGVYAPIVALDTGCAFQDVGSYPSTAFDPRGTGPANVTFDKYLDNPSKPRLCGDSLVVAGPLPSPTDPNTRWEARLWWRVARRAVFNADNNNGVPTRYKIWRDRVADGRAIDRVYRPEFTFGWMDSAQIGSNPRKDKFISSFREDDDDFVSESSPENEMIWDDVLYPGTRIEYFVTSNYRNSPALLYYYPDTTGGNLLEFEVLPGLLTANVPGCGGTGFNYCAFMPATLYIDAFNAGAQIFIENALRTVLNGEPVCMNPMGCPIPADRNWDRYDYADAASSWVAPFGRGAIAGSNNGMTLQQILGYRTILVNTGSYTSGAMDDEDFALFDQWLVTPLCESNVNRQAFLMNGDGVGQVLENFPSTGVPLMRNTLGAALFCDAFNGASSDPDCGPIDTSYCVRLLPPDAAVFGSTEAIDAFGNGCPSLYGFNVLSPNGTGVGNRGYWSEEGPKQMDFSQIANEDLSTGANYRTVLDGVSWHHMTLRNSGGQGSDRCPRDLPSVSGAIAAEMGSALRWAYDAQTNNGIPKLTSAEVLATCQSTWTLGGAGAEDAADVRVNRLWQNDPNPFNPRTTIKYSLARSGAVKILVYDVSGRLVRTLIDAKEEAGAHAAVWDGTNDRGDKAGSGVYWVQMRVADFVSNKKMVILK